MNLERDKDAVDIAMAEKGFSLLEIRGDGNCGYYSLLLGLVRLNKIPVGIKQSNALLVAAVYKLRTELFSFMNLELETMWRAAINTSNVLPSEKYFLDKDRKYQFLSQLWHKDISLSDYSHMADY